MTRGPLVFPFDLRAVRFEEDSQEWVVLIYTMDRGRASPPAASPAECDVLARVLAGHSNAAIAQARGTSPRTVANQVAELLRRFQLRSRRDLIARFGTGESVDRRADDSRRSR